MKTQQIKVMIYNGEEWVLSVMSRKSAASAIRQARADGESLYAERGYVEIGR